MAAIGLVPGFVIGLREGIEGALIVGLITAYLTRTDRRNLVKYVVFGLIAAIIASIVVAGALVGLSVGLDGVAEELFEGVSAILAVTVLTFMIFWMMRTAEDVRGHFESRVDALAGKREKLGLMGLAFVAVFREGVETALFMLGVASATTTADAVAGVSIGIFAAALIGFSLPWISTRISIKRFFQITSLILIFMAAGLLATGVHELQEAFEIQAGAGQVYNLQGVFSSGEGNPMGYLLHGIIGYSDSPSQLQVVAYLAYLASALLIWRFIALGKAGKISDESEAPEIRNEKSTAESVIQGEASLQSSALVDTNENAQ